LAYLSHVFGNTDVEITENERIILIEPEYLYGLLPLLIATPEKTQGDKWRHINHSRVARELRLKFSK
jgi:hypothetical protein